MKISWLWKFYVFLYYYFFATVFLLTRIRSPRNLHYHNNSTRYTSQDKFKTILVVYFSQILKPKTHILSTFQSEKSISKPVGYVCPRGMNIYINSYVTPARGCIAAGFMGTSSLFIYVRVLYLIQYTPVELI